MGSKYQTEPLWHESLFKAKYVGKFLLSYWFFCTYNFLVVRGPVFCPVSGFCTSYGCIKIFFYRKISVVLQIVFSEFIVLKRIFRLVIIGLVNTDRTFMFTCIFLCTPDRTPSKVLPRLHVPHLRCWTSLYVFFFLILSS